MGHAPLIQVMFTAQFTPAISPLNPLEIAGLSASVWPDFPLFAQIDPAGLMVHSFGQLEGQEPILAPNVTMPRVQLTSADRSTSVYFQADRLSYSWSRTNSLAEEVSYPGYDVVVAEFHRHLNSFVKWIADNRHAEVNLVASEISYSSGFRTKDDDGSERRLSSIYTFINPDVSYKVRGYEYSWNEAASGDGVLVVRVNGPALTMGDIPTSLVTLSATAYVAEVGLQHHRSALDRLHGSIEQVFERIVHAERRATY